MFWAIIFLSIQFSSLNITTGDIVITQEINYINNEDYIKEKECEFLKSKWRDCSQFQQSEKNWNIKYWVISCIAVAETWLWKNTMRDYNIWNCWKHEYPNWSAWIDWIQKYCLNWKYLWNKKIIWDYWYWAGECKIDCDKYYARDWNNWEKNMINCLSNIYWFKIDLYFNIKK